MVRFDTYNASAHLVRQLENSGVVSVVHDGADNLLVELASGELISIYLIETRFPTSELRSTLAANMEDDVYSLVILWRDMFLHHEGQAFQPDDWLLSLVELYSGKVYAFDVFGKDIRIFPAYFEPLTANHAEYGGQGYHIRYGADIDVTDLGCDTVTFDGHATIGGTWYIADFSHEHQNRKNAAHHARTGHKAGRRTSPSSTLSPWDVLQITPSDDRAAIKRAYRRLAQRYHPDINRSLDATKQMQALNQAYEAILRLLDSPVPKA